MNRLSEVAGGMAQGDARSEVSYHRIQHTGDWSIQGEPHSAESKSSSSSIEKIRRQLSAGSGNVLLQGTLLKRSETLRKWNQRWFTLDPGTGKMDYRLARGDLTPRGVITFDAESTITMSPINFQGAKKYDGCCFYIGTPHKKEYYLCAENQVIARAWVATLRASALVLKAHKDAVSSLSGSGAAKLGTVAAVVAAANSVAREAARDIEAEVQASMKAVLGAKSSQADDSDMDSLSIMKFVQETLKVKDEELQQLSRDLRARDVTIKELANRLGDTANAAEAAAAAAQAMDKERKAAKAEVDRARKELEDRTKVIAVQLRAAEESHRKLCNERDEAVLEAQRWQKELAKAREGMLVMEGHFRQSEQAMRKGLADLDEILKAKDAELAELKRKLALQEKTTVPEMPNNRLEEQQHQQQEENIRATNPDQEVKQQSQHLARDRATNPEEEVQQQQEEAVKAEVLQQPAVPSEPREVLVDTYSPEVSENVKAQIEGS